jgi:hypothetical protein
MGWYRLVDGAPEAFSGPLRLGAGPSKLDELLTKLDSVAHPARSRGAGLERLSRS